MKTIYLFDVDGTLTPAKSEITPTFKKQFLEWSRGREVYIVSGGTFTRIINQLTREVVDQMQGVFSCMGNAFYLNMGNSPGGYSEWDLMYKNKFSVEKRELFFSELERYVMKSGYHTKTGNHYEERVGMVNFSIVGRNATMEERLAYAAYDAEHNEREEIVKKLSKKHPTLDFVIGGAVSIDIYNKGNDKAQVLKQFLSIKQQDSRIVFVGDRTEFPGNDHSLALALSERPNSQTVGVESWEDTAVQLKTGSFAST